jgi:hypothetical protein
MGWWVTGTQMEKRHRDWRLKTPRAGTAWVHVQNTIPPGVSRPVRMSADDYVELGCGGLEVQLSNVVGGIDQAGPGLADRCHRQVGRPKRPADGGRW